MLPSAAKYREIFNGVYKRIESGVLLTNDDWLQILSCLPACADTIESMEERLDANNAVLAELARRLVELERGAAAGILAPIAPAKTAGADLLRTPATLTAHRTPGSVWDEIAKKPGPFQHLPETNDIEVPAKVQIKYTMKPADPIAVPELETAPQSVADAAKPSEEKKDKAS